jgi:hypothetical protein
MMLPNYNGYLELLLKFKAKEIRTFLRREIFMCLSTIKKILHLLIKRIVPYNYMLAKFSTKDKGGYHWEGNYAYL